MIAFYSGPVSTFLTLARSECTQVVWRVQAVEHCCSSYKWGFTTAFTEVCGWCTSSTFCSFYRALYFIQSQKSFKHALCRSIKPVWDPSMDSVSQILGVLWEWKGWGAATGNTVYCSLSSSSLSLWFNRCVMVQPQVWWGMEIAGCWEGAFYYLHWAALMCMIATCWGNVPWGSLCISSLVPLKTYAIPAENTPGVQIQVIPEMGASEAICAASMNKALKHPQGTWAFDWIHRAETKPGIAGLRRDLSGYLRQWPVAQKDSSMYKNISRDPPVHTTVLAILASGDLSSRKAMAL